MDRSKPHQQMRPCHLAFRASAFHPCRLIQPAVAVFVSLLLIGLLTACGSGDGSLPDDHPISAGEPQHGGTLTIALQDDAISLDPHQVLDAASIRMSENLYSTLMRYTPTYGEIEPDLAESVDVSEDGLTYTFRLRPDARFHSGRSVTSQDVIYSLERIIDLDIRADQLRDIAHMHAPDDRIVVLQLEQPSAPLLTSLAYPMNAIVDRQVVQAGDGRIDQVSAGSGPFKLVQWRAGQHLILERHEGYHHDPLPYLDRVIFRPIPDETARTTSLRTGEIDMILDVAAKDVRTLERARGVTVQSVTGTFWEYLGFNCRQSPFDNPQVRQAIAMAIDRNMVNQLIKLGRATPLTGGHLPPHHWASLDEAIHAEPDLEQARSLLAKAGYGEGFSAVIKVGSAFPYQVQAAELIKDQLRAINVDLHIQQLESTIFFSDLGSGDFQMTLVGWVGFVDPDEWMWNIFHSQGKYNQQGYANAQLDKLLTQGRQELDQNHRAEIYQQAQRLVVADAPMVFLYVNDQITAYRNRVQDYVVHPTQTTLFLRSTWLAGVGRDEGI